MKRNGFGVLGRHVHPWKYKENHKGMYKTNYRKQGNRAKWYRTRYPFDFDEVR